MPPNLMNLYGFVAKGSSTRTGSKAGRDGGCGEASAHEFSKPWLSFGMGTLICFRIGNRSFLGSGRPRGPLRSFQKVGGEAPPTFWKGLRGPRCRTDPKSDRSLILNSNSRTLDPTKVHPILQSYSGLEAEFVRARALDRHTDLGSGPEFRFWLLGALESIPRANVR